MFINYSSGDCIYLLLGVNSEPKMGCASGGVMESNVLEKLEQLREGAMLLEDRIIVTCGSEHPTVESVNKMYDEFEALMQNEPMVWNIHVFNQHARPSNEVRHLVVERFSRLKSRVGHVALVANTNLFVQMGALLVSFRLGYRHYSFHPNFAQAYRAIKRHSVEI